MNYTTVEKETLAIIKAIKHFKTIIFNSHITIKTDNANLIFNGELTRRIQRWKYQLEEYEYQLEHKKGKNNFLADSLSRISMIKELKHKKIVELEEISKHQRMSKNLSNDYKTTKMQI